MKFELCTIDWTALSAIFTAAMVGVSYYSIWLLKRANDPKIYFSIIRLGDMLFLEISNAGLGYAREVTFSIDASAYPDSEIMIKWKEEMSDIASSPFVLKSNERKIFSFFPIMGVEASMCKIHSLQIPPSDARDIFNQIKDLPVVINGSYKATKCRKIKIHETFTIRNFRVKKEVLEVIKSKGEQSDKLY